MSRFVRDEKRTYPFTWLAIGGIFATSALWAGYAELTSRVPWQDNQQRFFELDLELARKAKEAAQAEWDQAVLKDPLKSLIEEQKKLDTEMQPRADGTYDDSTEYGKAQNRLAQLNAAFLAAETGKTFGASDLDEAYYYRNSAEYERDRAQVEVRKLYKELFEETEPARVEQPNTIYRDPPKPAQQDGQSKEMYHLISEIARMKGHVEQIEKAIAEGPPSQLVQALRASKKAELDVVAALETEVKHQTRIDEARSKMAAIDGPAEPTVAEKDPAKREAMVQQLRTEACAGKEDTRNCIKWLKIEPADAKLKAVTLAVSKAKRPLVEAEERFTNADAKAHPKFDPKNPLAFLVGTYEIKQTVTKWLDFKRDVDIQQVDRCETCHLGTDKPAYTASDIPREFRTHPRRDLLLASHPPDKFGCTACHQGQGRATNSEYAHSTMNLHEHHGDERWHMDGDHHWEDPLLQVGKLERIVVDAANDEFEIRIGKKKAPVKLEQKVYPTETEFLSELKSKVEAAVAGDAVGYKVVADKLDNRVRIGIEATSEADATKRPKAFGLSFPDIALGKLLGYVGAYSGSNIKADGSLGRRAEVESSSLVVTATNPPALPIRAAHPNAQGVWVESEKEYKYVPPNGAFGLQVSDAERNRFIQALPEVESGCLRCHATDADLAPHNSRAKFVEAKFAYEKAEAERAHDPEGYRKAHGSDELPRVPSDTVESASLAPTLDQGRYLFRQLNCNGCHLLEGYENNKDAGPALDHVSAKADPEWLLSWIRYPRGFRAKTSMPNLWPPPIEPASKVPYAEGTPEHTKWHTSRADETIAIASYLYERSENPATLPGSTSKDSKPLREKIKGYASVEGASAEEGKALFEGYGCQGCHANTEGAGMPDTWRARERDIAPNLANIAAKTNADWLAYWIEDPQRYWHGTAMPNLRLTRKESASVAQYLMTLKSAPIAPAGVTKDEAAIVADAKKRAELVTCAAAGGAKMSRVDCGEKTIAYRGCYGCHRISGFENYAPIGPELSGFAKKDTTTFDYGYAIADHNLQTTETYASLKLDSPRIYSRDRVELKMGDFDLSAEEIRALVVFLKGTVPSTPTEAFDPMKKEAYAAQAEGRRLVNDLNCRGCHMLEGRGAEIDGWRQAQLQADAQARAPWLDGEGARVQPEWLFNFLRKPEEHGIRPFMHPEWAYKDEVPTDKLALRMPSFRQLTPEQWTAVVRYFAAWDGESYPYQVPTANPLTKDEKLWALTNMNSDQAGNCQKCHFYGEFPVKRGLEELAALAPNIAEMKHRLRPDWVQEWLLRPTSYLLYTKMPAFFASVNRPKTASRWPDENDPYLSPPAVGWNEAVPGFEKLNAEQQATLIRDFLYTIPDGAPWPARGSEAGSILVDPEAAAVAQQGEGKDGKEDKDAKDKKKDGKKAPRTGAVPGPLRF
jgi:cytochrome c551/c552